MVNYNCRSTVWPWCGLGVALVWPWCGLGVALVWLWCGLGVALVWPWCGFGVALVWLWCGFALRSLCLVYAYNMALGWLWVALRGLPPLFLLSTFCFMLLPECGLGWLKRSSFRVHPPSAVMSTLRSVVHQSGSSVVLADVGVGFVEELLIGVEFVFEEGAAEFLLDQALALGGVLPVGEADLFHDVIYVGNDTLDDDVGVMALGF